MIERDASLSVEQTMRGELGMASLSERLGGALTSTQQGQSSVVMVAEILLIDLGQRVPGSPQHEPADPKVQRGSEVVP